MFDVTKVGKRIKKIRGSMKQEECADKIGISRAALSYYENGTRKMDIDILFKFCMLFNVSADYLLGISDNPTTKEDIKTAIKTTGLNEKVIEKIGQNEFTKKALNYILYNAHFDKVLSVFLSAKINKKYLYNSDHSNTGEVLNNIFEALNINDGEPINKLQLDLIGNGIEPIYKQIITESMINLFNEYKGEL